MFGAKLRFIRQQHHLSQAVLAQRLGFSTQSHISNLENGYRPPTLQVVVMLSQLFHVPIAYWLLDEIPVEVHNSSVAEIIQAVVEPPVTMTFGTRLRQLREEHHLTQFELASMLSKTTQGHISLLEHGLREPSLALVCEVATVFRVSFEWLLLPATPDNSQHNSS